MAKSIFEKFDSRLKAENIKKNTSASRKWFLSNAEKLKISRQTLIADPLITIGKQIPNSLIEVIGHMFFFRYDPKGKVKLPYWDEFPIVIPFDLQRNHFLGMNLHYLPPAMRAILLNRLMLLISDTNFDATTRLRVTYQTLKDSAKFRHFKPTVKKYLKTHIQSNIVKIPSEQRELATFLPLQIWHTSTQDKVWRDSQNKINQG